ncbi:hypothetical protein NDU88_006194 [Pleurodeles waltl]|uniref:Uncharacterized protein n=1 Tax=Pleurodeles waltl TaxID=8319 RepID=A0AAV7QIC7_PLEWA|nr:hypothetical protein NDU88_006194 [Pleurodeles waltl]
MPGGRTTSKQSGKPSRQLLFSEALRHQRVPPTEEHPLIPPSSMAEPTQGATMDLILQEISAVGRKLEGMDSTMASLTVETKSMRLDIAGFQSQVTGLNQQLTGITFDPPLAFQRVHRLGPKRRDDANRPRPITACLLRHVQTCQLLQAARAHGPYRLDDLEARLTADFSKETSKRSRAFLALRPRLRQLDVKYGLFEPARMWITKNGVSRDFYDPKTCEGF